ncbi:uncharacterized protein TNIN_307841 [Trichonephila inaurata madagascariensis]|uniref:Uncharacterized protein n=1 Tax=Trichonephila inaurata madagascariensis TaxID=2747483 RepID=A0A8X6MK93_9ARAC|nr:uncharacterized protein TNIN_307841 [Trichonephila inaurata madagascariensis]
MNCVSLVCVCCLLTFFAKNVRSDESGPTRGVISRLGENLEQETRLEDRIVEVLNQQEIKENLDSVGHYVGVIGTGVAAGLGTILGNTEQVIKSLQKK